MAYLPSCYRPPVGFTEVASAKNPDGSWASYTAIPSGPIDPSNGHQFTNPNVNFGGEHFGVGYRANPTAVRYHWLIDDGAGNLIAGPPVQVSTPSYTYVAPAGGAPGRLQAAIEAPEPPEIHPLEFGEPTWVKEIVTTSHNNHKNSISVRIPRNETHVFVRLSATL